MIEMNEVESRGTSRGIVSVKEEGEKEATRLTCPAPVPFTTTTAALA
jgi:hypothetical protein